MAIRCRATHHVGYQRPPDVTLSLVRSELSTADGGRLLSVDRLRAPTTNKREIQTILRQEQKVSAKRLVTVSTDNLDSLKWSDLIGWARLCYYSAYYRPDIMMLQWNLDKIHSFQLLMTVKHQQTNRTKRERGKNECNWDYKRTNDKQVFGVSMSHEEITVISHLWGLCFCSVSKQRWNFIA